MVQAGEWENPINLASGPEAVSSGESSEHLALSFGCSPIPSPEGFHSPMQAPSTGKHKDEEGTEASRPGESDQPAEATAEPQTQTGTEAGPSVPPASGIPAEILASELLRATKGKGRAESPDDDDVPLSRRKAQLLAEQIAVLRARLDAQSKAFDIARESELKAREREIEAKAALVEAKARLQSETKTQEESKDREEKEESTGDKRKRQRHTKAEKAAFKKEQEQLAAQKALASQAAQAKPLTPVQKQREAYQTQLALKGRGGGRGGRGGRGSQVDILNRDVQEIITVQGNTSNPAGISLAVVTTPSQQTAQVPSTSQKEQPTPAETQATRLVPAQDQTVTKRLLYNLRTDLHLKAKLQTPGQAADNKSAFPLSPKEQRDIALGLSQYKHALKDIARVNFHTTTATNAFEYHSRVLNYGKLPLPANLLDKAQYSWGQTVNLEICSAWLSQGNLQLGGLTNLLAAGGAGKYANHVREFLIVLEHTLSNIRSAILDNLTPKAVTDSEKLSLEEGEIAAVTNVLWCGEELLVCVQNQYLDLL